MIDDWVELTEYESRICTWVGEQRLKSALEHNRYAGKGPSATRDTPDNHIRGAHSEFAASIVLNLYWRPFIGEIHNRDVGGLVEVRSGTELWHRLIIKPPDVKEKAYLPFVLMIEQPGRRYGFAGWAYAWEARDLPLIDDHGDACHFIDQERLHPRVELDNWIAERWR